jgi:hypothetical protein
MTTAGLVASITAVAAGCGGGSSAAAKAVTTTTPTTVAGRGASLQAFRQCMSTHGVTIPQRTGGGGGGAGTSTSQPADTGGTPGVNGGGGGAAGRFLQPPAGVDPAKYQTALAACRSLIPTGGGGGTGGAQFRTAYIAYVTCLRNHGVQTGDPSLAQQALTGVDRTSAAFIAAAQACRPLLPQRNPGTTTTTTVGA